MAPPKRQQFINRYKDLDSKRIEEENVIKEYSLLPLDDSPELIEATAERRAVLIKK